MRADTHDGPEQNRSTSEALYIDAALTFVGLGTPSCNARPGHTNWHICDLSRRLNEDRLRQLSGRVALAPRQPGLTQCMVRPCVARGFRRGGGERSCINVSGL